MAVAAAAATAGFAPPPAEAAKMFTVSPFVGFKEAIQAIPDSAPVSSYDAPLRIYFATEVMDYRAALVMEAFQTFKHHMTVTSVIADAHAVVYVVADYPLPRAVLPSEIMQRYQVFTLAQGTAPHSGAIYSSVPQERRFFAPAITREHTEECFSRIIKLDERLCSILVSSSISRSSVPAETVAKIGRQFLDAPMWPHSTFLHNIVAKAVEYICTDDPTGVPSYASTDSALVCCRVLNRILSSTTAGSSSDVIQALLKGPAGPAGSSEMQMVLLHALTSRLDHVTETDRSALYSAAIALIPKVINDKATAQSSWAILCHILANFAIHRVGREADVPLGPSVAQVCLTALERNSNHGNTVQEVFRALSLAEDVLDRAYLIEHNILGYVRHTFIRFLRYPAILAQTLELLSVLLSSETAKAVISNGLVTSSIVAMNSQPEEMAVQLAGCAVLHKLAAISVHMVGHVVFVGGADAAFSAAAACFKDAAAILSVCKLFRRLSDSPTHGPMLLDRGLVEIMAAICCRHPEAQELQSICCSTLLGLLPEEKVNRQHISLRILRELAPLIPQLDPQGGLVFLHKILLDLPTELCASLPVALMEGLAVQLSKAADLSHGVAIALMIQKLAQDQAFARCAFVMQAPTSLFKLLTANKLLPYLMPEDAHAILNCLLLIKKATPESGNRPFPALSATQASGFLSKFLDSPEILVSIVKITSKDTQTLATDVHVLLSTLADIIEKHMLATALQCASFELLSSLLTESSTIEVFGNRYFSHAIAIIEMHSSEPEILSFSFQLLATLARFNLLPSSAKADSVLSMLATQIPHMSQPPYLVRINTFLGSWSTYASGIISSGCLAATLSKLQATDMPSDLTLDLAFWQTLVVLAKNVPFEDVMLTQILEWGCKNMARFPLTPALQLAGCQFLEHTLQKKAKSIEFINQGAVPRILAAVTTFPECVEPGVGALCLFSASSAEALDHFIEKSGLDPILKKIEAATQGKLTCSPALLENLLTLVNMVSSGKQWPTVVVDHALALMLKVIGSPLEPSSSLSLGSQFFVNVFLAAGPDVVRAVLQLGAIDVFLRKISEGTEVVSVSSIKVLTVLQQLVVAAGSLSSTLPGAALILIKRMRDCTDTEILNLCCSILSQGASPPLSNNSNGKQALSVSWYAYSKALCVRGISESAAVFMLEQLSTLTSDSSGQGVDINLALHAALVSLSGQAQPPAAVADASLTLIGHVLTCSQWSECKIETESTMAIANTLSLSPLRGLRALLLLATKIPHSLLALDLHPIIFSSMTQSPADVQVQEVSCALLAKLVTGQVSPVSWLRDCIAPVLVAMSTHRTSATVQSMGLTVLAEAAPMKDLTDSASLAMIIQVVAATKENPQSPAVRGSAAQAALALCAENKTGTWGLAELAPLIELIHDGVLELGGPRRSEATINLANSLYTIVDKSSGETKASPFCRLLALMPAAGDGDLQVSLTICRMLALLLQDRRTDLSTKPASVIKSYLAAIVRIEPLSEAASLLTLSSQHSDALFDSGGWHRALELLRDERVYTKIIQVLGALQPRASSADIKACFDILKESAWPVWDDEKLWPDLDLLGASLLDAETVDEPMVDWLRGSILPTMLARRDSVPIQTHGMQLLLKAGQRFAPKEHRREWSAVVGAMRGHGSNALLQRLGLQYARLECHKAIDGESARRFFYVLLAAMQQHASDEQVQRLGCETLLRFASLWSYEMQAQIAVLLSKTMRMHASLSAPGLAALAGLSVPSAPSTL